MHATHRTYLLPSLLCLDLGLMFLETDLVSLVSILFVFTFSLFRRGGFRWGWLFGRSTTKEGSNIHMD